MSFHLFRRVIPANPVKNEMPLYQFLKNKIEKNYTDLNPFLKIAQGIGNKGVNRANVLINFLSNIQTEKETVDFLLMNIKYFPEEKSLFGDGKNLRQLIARSLMQYFKLPFRDLNKVMREEAPVYPIPTYSPQLHEVRVASRMIQKYISEHPLSSQSYQPICDIPRSKM